jgi:hypothetical protein
MVAGGVAACQRNGIAAPSAECLTRRDGLDSDKDTHLGLPSPSGRTRPWGLLSF